MQADLHKDYLLEKEYLNFSIIFIENKLSELTGKTNKLDKDISSMTIHDLDSSQGFIDGKEEIYKSGIVVMPVYLSKGLEFDVVFIANVNDKNYTFSELDIKLLYVAMTRPLYKLFLYFHGTKSELLKELDVYEFKNLDT